MSRKTFITFALGIAGLFGLFFLDAAIEQNQEKEVIENNDSY